MGKWGAAAILLLAGCAALYPRFMPWAYIAAFMAFELWLLGRMKTAGQGAVAVDEPPMVGSAHSWVDPVKDPGGPSILKTFVLKGLPVTTWSTAGSPR